MFGLHHRQAGVTALISGVFLLGLLMGVPAFASGGESGFVLKTHGNYILDFVVLIAGLIYFAKKPISQFLSSRYDAARKALEDSERLVKEAEALRKEYEERMEKLASEVDEIKRQFRREGELERDKIIADAQAQAAKILSETRFLIEQDYKKAREHIQREVVEKAIEMAKAQLMASLGSREQEEFVERSIKDLNDIKLEI